MSTLGTLTTNVSINLGDRLVGEFFTSAQIKKSIGDAYKYYVMLMLKSGEGYFERTDNLDIVANVETVSLAALTPAFFKISQLERYVTNGTIPLVKSERRYKNNYTLGVGTGDSYLPNYKQRGTNIILEPLPKFSETDALKIDYIYIPTFPTSVSADGFTFDADFPVLYEANVELRATIKCLSIKDSMGGIADISTFMGELSELDKAFLDSFGKDEGSEDID